MQETVAYHAQRLPAALVWRFGALCGGCRETAFYVVAAGHAAPDAQTPRPHEPAPLRLWRFQHHADPAALQRDLARLAVARLELGACYEEAPRLLRTLALPLRPVARDLVFDVDIDAYDAAPAWARRRCCAGGAALCRRCWPLLACAAECLDVVLRTRLGFQHVLHVFSGRRGVHVWVCDALATTLTEGGRGVALHMIAAAVTALGRPSTATAATTTTPALAVAAPLDVLHEDTADLVAIMRRHASEFARRQLETSMDVDDAGATDDAEMRAAARDAPSAAFVAAAVAPRFDAAVTLQLAHLLRAPLVAHPACGGIALPLPLAALLALDPATDGVRAGELCAALDAAEQARPFPSTGVVARFERARAHLQHFVEAAERAR